MTRAAERLIVAGYDPANGHPKGGCWYDLVRDGLGTDLVEAPAPFGGEAKIWRFGEGLRAEDGAESPQIRPDKTLPDWLMRRAAPETLATPLSPSRIGGGAQSDRQRALEGRLAHALLETLPDVAPERRARAASDYLDLTGAALPNRRATRSPPRFWPRSARPSSLPCLAPARAAKSR